jgi:hypothetical protein
MAVCLIRRYRDLAVLVRSYRLRGCCAKARRLQDGESPATKRISESVRPVDEPSTVRSIRVRGELPPGRFYRARLSHA